MGRRLSRAEAQQAVAVDKVHALQARVEESALHVIAARAAADDAQTHAGAFSKALASELAPLREGLATAQARTGVHGCVLTVRTH